MTLSSKICLLKEGLLQQYEPPLDVYHNPANHFVADFVGSPNINILEMEGEQVNLDEVKLTNKHLKLLYTPTTSSITVPKGKKLLLGIRPEDIAITDEGSIEAKIYSTLPSGMETIVKLDVDGLLLTCVVFGGVDFEIGHLVKIGFNAKNYVLFDADSELNIASGTLS
jgi:multiple sugar transport system ATP-binding protein